MKTKTKIWIYPLALMGILVVLVSGCKKDKSEPELSIGDSYGGGIIYDKQWREDNLMTYDGFYIYLIAATSDQSKSARYDTAVRICDQLVLNGYSDWFIPRPDDLNKMYASRAAIGGFRKGYYWCFDFTGNDLKQCINFKDGQSHWCSKDSAFCVRAVRSSR